ncbi:head decoration protein [Pseudomonas soli]|uniref:head decoration protein n=1 Tax=Pseudomonas soli TaxID=1306993 RepID=UPI000D8629C0|nr:head decoration protein [Pseudomonas soli]PYC45546.1 head decoration protein [Pseudomonas soli]
MNTKYIEPVHPGEFLLSEGAGKISREVIELAAGDALVAGQVLGQLSANGHFAPYKPDAEDGSETAKCILFASVGASEEVRRGRAVVRLAEVSEALLTGLDLDAEKALAAQFIIVR